jgi:hypothetical protein
MTKEGVIERLRGAIRAAVGEVQGDPEFFGRVVATVCEELGMDTIASMYLANKLKNRIKKEPDAS